MGRERRGTRQYLYFCIAGLIMTVLASCAPVGYRLVKDDDARLLRAQQLLAQGDFAGALRENRKVLALFPQSYPGDEALFNMGLINIHYANPKKDIGRALACFTRLEQEFPGSSRMEEAKTWISILQTMEKARQIDDEIEAKKRELRR